MSKLKIKPHKLKVKAKTKYQEKDRIIHDLFGGNITDDEVIVCVIENLSDIFQLTTVQPKKLVAKMSMIIFSPKGSIFYRVLKNSQFF